MPLCKHMALAAIKVSFGESAEVTQAQILYDPKKNELHGVQYNNLKMRRAAKGALRSTVIGLKQMGLVNIPWKGDLVWECSGGLVCRLYRK
jgi:hypothetical protein